MASSSRTVPPFPGFAPLEKPKQCHCQGGGESCIIHYYCDFFTGEPLSYLTLPREFNEYIIEYSPCHLILMEMSGLEWSVKMEFNGHRYLFSNGWLKFVKENGVKDRDTLRLSRMDYGRFKMEVYNYYGIQRWQAKATTLLVQDKFQRMGKPMPSYMLELPLQSKAKQVDEVDEDDHVPLEDPSEEDVSVDVVASDGEPEVADVERRKPEIGVAQVKQEEEEADVDEEGAGEDSVELVASDGNPEIGIAQVKEEEGEADVDEGSAAEDFWAELAQEVADNDELEGEVEEGQDAAEDVVEEEPDEDAWIPPLELVKVVGYQHVVLKKGLLLPKLVESWESVRGNRGKIILTHPGGSSTFDCVFHTGNQWRLGKGWTKFAREERLQIGNILRFELEGIGETPEYRVTIIR